MHEGKLTVKVYVNISHDSRMQFSLNIYGPTSYLRQKVFIYFLDIHLT